MLIQIIFTVWKVSKYGDLLGKSPYLIRIQENTNQKKLRIWTLVTQWFRYSYFLQKFALYDIEHSRTLNGAFFFSFPNSEKPGK